MARRKQQPESARTLREVAPLWISQYLQGLRRFNGDTAAWREARHEWCRTKGCWRPGTKTCAEASPTDRGCGHETDGKAR